MENPLHHFSIIDEPKYLLSNASLINFIVAPNSFLRLLSAKVIQAKRGLLHFQRITALLFKFGISWKSNKAKYWHINVVCALCMTMSTIHILDSKNYCIFTKLMKRKLFSIGFWLFWVTFWPFWFWIRKSEYAKQNTVTLISTIWLFWLTFWPFWFWIRKSEYAKQNTVTRDYTHEQQLTT